MTTLTRRRMPYRFAPMAIPCTWCHARAGALCTNQRGTRDMRTSVHSVRQIAWIRVMSTQCPEQICQAPAQQTCTITPDAHQARITAANTPTTTTP
ncbi:zinc finger domain-containing protein [Streptomyces turgidiscabies]|uniref:zinc finger domain-containing protein n=1 Tax=Streptomyces turgidiscabies TaxID=85558 RepID=UPI0038F614A7